MSMFGMLGGFHYSAAAHSAASSAQGAASRSESKASKAEWEVRALNDRLDKLSLICSAMWQLMQEKTDLTEEDLMAKVQELDLADGVADGKVTKKKLQNCPGCNRVMSPRHKRCLYCGTTIEKTEAFGGVL